ncbi:PREDICTED: mitochondrial basic amino acids transporter-like [Priapulus caudatus]|uniref:Mitochondrial basic amino acids transporter-like n=1 Tax=Priapulus caudatus TaxID=37621 RepID=A0ABM1EMC0_PRICU|nr:PREDICTED: mitochondrial basic amino acids transporter-like [Priapulus caudatus]
MDLPTSYLYCEHDLLQHLDYARNKKRPCPRNEVAVAVGLDFVAGCLGGCAGTLIGHPFDTVKVRLQLQSQHKPLYRNTFDCFKTIIQKESVLGLYKGLSSPMATLAFINAIVFGVYGSVIRHVDNPDALGNHFLAGCVAGAAQAVVLSPVELAKTYMQLQGCGEARGGATPGSPRRYRGSAHCIVAVWRRGGARGVFRGVWLTVLRETPSFGVYFYSFELVCRRMAEGAGKETGVGGLLLAGGISGMLSWLSTYPADVVKSRFQADGAGGKSFKYSGALDCAWQSYAAEGHRVFWRGLMPTLVRAFPVNAACLAVVSIFLRLTRRPKNDDEGNGA